MRQANEHRVAAMRGNGLVQQLALRAAIIGTLSLVPWTLGCSTPEKDPLPPGGTIDDIPLGDEFCYEEPIHLDADMTDLKAGYGPSNYVDRNIELVARLWPGGRNLMTKNRESANYETFTDKNDWNKNLDDVETLVHELTHYNNDVEDASLPYTSYLYINNEIELKLPDDKAFPRSEIKPFLPSEVAELPVLAQTYLTGVQGEKTFNKTLDELSAFTNELPVGVFVYANRPESVDLGRDYVVGMLNYLQVYLRVARTQHPEVYERLRQSPEHVKAVRLLWTRANYLLKLAEPKSALSYYEPTFARYTYDEGYMWEVANFIQARVDASNCVNKR